MNGSPKNQEKSNQPSLVFRTINSIEISPDALLEDLSRTTKLSIAELRQIIIGHGLNKFLFPEKIDPEMVFQTFKDHNVPAALIPLSPSIQPSVLGAHSLQASGSWYQFFDSKDNPILKIDKDSKLFIVVSDISGNDQHRRVLRSTYGTSLYNDLESVMKATAIYDPVADIHCSQHPELIMRIDPKKFLFTNLKSATTYSRSLNLSILLLEIISVCRDVKYDDYFGLSDLSARDIQELNRTVVLSKFTEYSIKVNNAYKHNVYANIIATQGSSPLDKKGHRKQPESELNVLLRRPSPPPIIEGTTFDRGWLTFAVLLLPLSGLSIFSAAYKTITNTTFLGTLFILGSFSVSMGLIIQSLYWIKCRRMVQNTPTSKVRSASMGIVELRGKGESEFELLSPFRMIPCLYYRCRMYSRKTSDDGVAWKLTRTYSSGKLPFCIADETGRIKVQPDKAFFCRSLFHRETIKNDLDSKTVLDIIPEGRQIYVLGFNQRKWHKKTVQDKIRERLQSIRYNKTDFARFDTNGDNRIDNKEMLRAAAEIEAEIRDRSSRVISPKRDVTIGPSPHGRTPLIIASSEKELIKRLGMDTLIYLFSGFVLLALASTVMLL